MSLNNPKSISQTGIDLITRGGYDDLRLSAYLCPSNYLTIGFGHLLLPKFDYRLFNNLDTNHLARIVADCQTGKRVTAEARKRLVISVDQAHELLRRDLQIVADYLRTAIQVQLNQYQFDALGCFIFNVGQGQFATSTLRKKLNAGDYAGAAAEFNKWCSGTVDGKKQRLPGLIKRRADERALFELGGA